MEKLIRMTRESIAEEPVVDDEILEQNRELMDDKFPDALIDDWQATARVLIQELIEEYEKLNDEDLQAKAHKAAGSTLQLGGHQLGTALRTVSHMMRSDARNKAVEILQDVPKYLSSFISVIYESKEAQS
jgi:Zn-dependent oligopeptidase